MTTVPGAVSRRSCAKVAGFSGRRTCQSSRRACQPSGLTRIWYQVGRPAMFEGNRFFALGANPIWKSERKMIRFDVWLPVPFGVAMRREKSLTFGSAIHGAPIPESIGRRRESTEGGPRRAGQASGIAIGRGRAEGRSVTGERVASTPVEGGSSGSGGGGARMENRPVREPGGRLSRRVRAGPAGARSARARTGFRTWRSGCPGGWCSRAEW